MMMTSLTSPDPDPDEADDDGLTDKTRSDKLQGTDDDGVVGQSDVWS